ncbi:uncharacterized protein BCR38DRAFT_485637 [Pseudomassariella vexata]|uniref:Ribosomal protein YMR-31 n=1 Tax=Pseudomassariella vexata TaxID=1141098 RepID=A0A1Y2DZ35_9PEZI|nr:uncharacterized protein BCR38DRAFT_485637 [Pseudomassariella vexata]ORY64489.1 hypothetical protein BCR38DRAFT_485637 [Pseudomassariella vexata]
MFATRALRQAAQAAERTPLIRFIGKHQIPSKVDHTPQPHPASPTGALPGNSHSTFSSYRDHAQQHGPLRKTIDTGRIGSQPGAKLGPVAAPKGMYFDRSELPVRFRRAPIEMSEIEAVESGGAALFG